MSAYAAYEESGWLFRSLLMIGLRSATRVGDEELRVRIGIASQNSEYVQSDPAILIS